MPDNIISIDRIHREAKAAAATYSDINAACPYPFQSEAGRIFKEAFLTAQRNLQPEQTS